MPTPEQPDYPQMERRRNSIDPSTCHLHEKRIALVERDNEGFKGTLNAVSTKLDLILAQITKVAILEEKHANQQVDITRAHAKVESLEEQVDKDFDKLKGVVDSLAIETRAFINYSKGRDKVLWAIGGVVFALVVKALFFAANHGLAG